MYIENAPVTYVAREIGSLDRGAYAKVIASMLPNHVQYSALKTMDSLRKVNAI